MNRYLRFIVPLLALLALGGFSANQIQTAQVGKVAHISLGVVLNTPITVYTSPASASGTGSIANNIMTIASGVSGTFAVGQNITGTGTSPAFISALGTGTGGTGTYFISTPQTVTSTTLSAWGAGSLIKGCWISTNDTNAHTVTILINGIPQTTFSIPASSGVLFPSFSCFTGTNWQGIPTDASGNSFPSLAPGDIVTMQFGGAIGAGNIYANLAISE